MNSALQERGKCWRQVWDDSGKEERAQSNRRRPRCRSLVQANAIGVTVQEDHMTHTVIIALYLFTLTHTHTKIPPCYISLGVWSHNHRSKQISVQTYICPHIAAPTSCPPWAHISECSTCCQSPPSLLLTVPVSSPSLWMDAALRCHVIAGCVSLQTIWALRGLVDLQPDPPPPLGALCLRGIQGGHLVISSAAPNFLLEGIKMN